MTIKEGCDFLSFFFPDFLKVFNANYLGFYVTDQQKVILYQNIEVIHLKLQREHLILELCIEPELRWRDILTVKLFIHPTNIFQSDKTEDAPEVFLLVR